MNFLEYHEIIQIALPNLKLNTTYLTGNQNFNYEVNDLISLRKALHVIEDTPYIQKEINQLKNTWLFNSLANIQKITAVQKIEVDEPLNLIKIKLETFKEIAESSKLYNHNDIILIKIPEIQSFDNFAKYASDFKKAIELPILDESIKGEVTILSADEGSIVLYVSLGAIAAVTLVARICWAATVIKKKNAEANIFEQHAKTLELKNDALASIIEAQNIQLKNILDAEANAIANKTYNHNDQETIERLKLSISTVADLIDRGVKILPVSKDEEIQKSFPDYSKMNLIESSIKQITSEN